MNGDVRRARRGGIIAGLFPLLLLACGGEDSRPPLAVVCTDRCCGYGSLYPTHVPARTLPQVQELRELSGTYEVPLYWLPPDARVPLAPGEVAPHARSTLMVQLDYAGGDMATIPPCNGDPVLPVRLSLASQDGRLDTEVLALARGTRGHYELVDLQVPGAQVELVVALPAEARARQTTTLAPGDAGREGLVGGESDRAWDRRLHVPLAHAAWTALPGLSELRRDGAPPGTGACVHRARFVFDGEQGVAGHVCLPEFGLAVWPVACGGTATMALADAPEHELDALVDSELRAVGPFAGLVALDVKGQQDVCLVRPLPPLVPNPHAELARPGPKRASTSALGVVAADLTLAVAGVESRVRRPVVVGTTEPAWDTSAALQGCFDYDEGGPLTSLLAAALTCIDCDLETDDDVELAELASLGVVSGSVCVTAELRSMGSPAARSAELSASLRGADGRMRVREWVLLLE